MALTNPSWDDLSDTDPTAVTWESLSDTPPEQPAASSGLISGSFSALKSGLGNLSRSAQATGSALTGDNKNIEALAEEGKAAQLSRPVEARQFEQSLQQKTAESMADDGDVGWLDAIGNVAAAAWENKTGAVQTIAEQFPNAAPVLAAGWGGAQVGALGGPLAPVTIPLGAFTGMFLGNAMIETGAKAMEKAEGGLTDVERGEAISEGAVKGAVIAGVDLATLGLGKYAMQTIGKSAIKAGATAEADVIAKAGIDITNPATVAKALAADPALKAAAAAAGNAAAKSSITAGQKLAMAGTGLGLETVGETAGEYVGELAATGKGDVTGAVLEGMMSLGQSSVETAYNYSKIILAPDTDSAIQAAAAAIDVPDTQDPIIPPRGELATATQAHEQTSPIQPTQPIQEAKNGEINVARSPAVGGGLIAGRSNIPTGGDAAIVSGVADGTNVAAGSGRTGVAGEPLASVGQDQSIPAPINNAVIQSQEKVSEQATPAAAISPVTPTRTGQAQTPAVAGGKPAPNEGSQKTDAAREVTVSQSQPASPAPPLDKTAAAPIIKMLSDGRHAAVGFTPEQLKAADPKVFIDGKGNGIFPAKTNKIQLERALGVSKIPEGAVLAEGDKPYKNLKSALLDRKYRGMDKTHISQRIEGGFALVPKAAKQEVKVNAQRPIESKPQSQARDESAQVDASAVGEAVSPVVQPLGAKEVQANGDGSGREIVSVKDSYGRTHLVRKSDLNGYADRIPTVRKNGDIISGEEIPRSIIKPETTIESAENIKPTAESALSSIKQSDIPAAEQSKAKKLEVLKAQAQGKISSDQGAALKELADAGEHAAVDEVLGAKNEAASIGTSASKELNKVSQKFWKGETFAEIAPKVVTSRDVYTKKEPKFTGQTLGVEPTEFDYYLTDGRTSQKISKDVYDHIESLKATKPSQSKNNYPSIDIYQNKNGKHQLLARTTQFETVEDALSAWMKEKPSQPGVDISAEKTPDEKSATRQNESKPAQSTKAEPASTEGGKTGGIMFSKTKNGEPTLIIQHNLSEENLLHAERMGGIPIPSLAITQADHPLTGFGEITLVGGIDMADPKGYAATKVFGADIYSPRYPNIQHQFTSNMKQTAEGRLKEAISATNTRLPWDDMENGSRELERSAPVMWQFLKDNGIKPVIKYHDTKPLDKSLQPFADKLSNREVDYFDMQKDPEFIDTAYQTFKDKLIAANGEDYRADADAEISDMRNRAKETGKDYFVNSIAQEINHHIMNRASEGDIDKTKTRYALEKQISDAGLRNEMEGYAKEFFNDIGANERIFQGYTKSGNRKYIPHTLDNVIKLLKKELRGGESFNYGVGTIRSKFAPQFKSIKQIQDAKNRLMDKAAFEKVKDEIDKEFFALAEEFGAYHPIGNKIGFGDTMSSTLYDAATMGLPRAFRENGFEDAPQEKLKDAAEFLDKLRSLPTEYFEAKILRAVDLSEFKGAVVPDDISQKALDALEKRGIQNVIKYKHGDEVDRKAKIKQLSTDADLMFSRTTNSTTSETPATIAQSLRDNPNTSKYADILLKRGDEGKKGGIVIAKDIESLPELFKEKTGVELGEDVLQSVAGNQTDTPAFKKWFGDSKVVDADGNPLVVYHNTKNEFNSFEVGRPTKNATIFGSYDAKRYGLFFAENASFASEFGGKKMDVFLQISDPADLTNLRDAFLNTLDANGYNSRMLTNGQHELWELFDEEYGGDHLVEILKKMGYDGAIISELDENRNPQKVWVAFEPSQIKSAIGNRGTFSPNNPDIRYSKSGKVQALYDPRSGLTFMVANNLTKETAAPVALHETVHATDTKEMRKQAMDLLALRDSKLVPKKLREFLQSVYARMESAGVVGDEMEMESASYIVEQALLLGRQDGFSAIDNTLFAHLTDKLGKRVSEFVRNWVAKVRAALFKRGVAVKLSVDDIIALAKAGMAQAARGDVNVEGDTQSFSKQEYTSSLIQQVWKKLSVHDNLFKFKKNNETSIEGNVLSAMNGEDEDGKSVSAKSKIKEIEVPEEMAKKDGVVKAWEVVSGFDDNPAFIYEADDGRVWLNVSNFKSGSSGGAALYTGVLDYAAKNKGVRLIGDPYGVTDIAMIRRTELMLSAAIRHGGRTDFMEPSNEQKYPNLYKGKLGHNDYFLEEYSPVKWGDNDAQNIDNLIKSAQDNISLFVPEVNNVHYNFTTGELEIDLPDQDGLRLRSENGRVSIKSDMGTKLVNQAMDRGFARAKRLGIEPDMAKRSPFGIASVVRAGLAQSLKDKSDSRRGSDETLSLFDGELPPGLKGVMYSKSGGVMLSKSAPPVNNESPKRFNIPQETSLQELQRKQQDNLNRIKVIQDAIQEQGGIVDEQSNVYQAMERMTDRVALQQEKFTDKVVEPFMKRVAELKTTTEEIGTYLMALGAKDRNAYIQTLRDDMPNNGSGITNLEAQEIIDDYRKRPDFEKFDSLARDIQKVTESKLDLLVEGNVMTADQAQQARDAMGFYVPYKGFEVIDDSGNKVGNGIGGGYSTSKRASRQALGRVSRAGQVVENIFRDYHAAIFLKEKANVGETLRNLVEDNPDSTLWTIEEPEKTPVKGKTPQRYEVEYYGSIVERFDNLNDARRFVESKRNVNDKEGDIKINKVGGEPTIIMRDIGFDNTKEVRYIKNGKEFRIQLHDPIMAAAYNNLNASQLGGILEASANLNMFLRQMYTQKNPEFIITNLFRDAQTAFAVLTGEGGAKYAAKAMSHVPSAAKAMFAQSRDKSMGVWQKYYDLARNSGALTAFAMLDDIETQQLKLDSMLARHGGGGVVRAWKQGLSHKGTILDRSGKAVSGAGKVVLYRMLDSRLMMLIENLNHAAENAYRMAAFRSFIDANGGVDKVTPKVLAEASRIAKNVTVNFNRKGEQSKAWNAAYLFWNANVQGTQNLFRAATGTKHKTQVKAIIGGLFALGVFAAMMTGDDDDELTSEYDKEHNLNLHFGEYTVKMILAYGLGFFFGAGYTAGNMMKGRISPMKAAVNTLGQFMEHFTPIGSPVDKGEVSQEKFAVNVSPTMLKPLMMSSVNANSFGGKLVPHFSDDDGKPDRETMYRSTRGTLYDKAANSAVLAWADVSPETLKMMAGFLTGGTGTFASNLYATGKEAVSGEFPDVEHTPFVRKIISTKDVEEYRGRFYDQLSEVKKKSGEDGVKQSRVLGGTSIIFWQKRMKNLRKAEEDARAEGSKAKIKLAEDRQIALSNQLATRYEKAMARYSKNP